MKKVIFFATAAAMLSSTAYAAPVSGSFSDGDGSSTTLTYSGTTPDNYFDDAGTNVSAQFTFRGNVSSVCAMQAVDAGSGPGLTGTVDLGTIGISAGDDQSVASLFTMTGPAHVTIHSDAAGCNYRNQVALEKDSVRGLRNTAPGSYDSDQFQANIPYSATASFTGVAAGAGHVAGTAQTVAVSTTQLRNRGNFGAWRSPLDIAVDMPQVTGKGLVGGDYEGTLTVSLGIL